MNERDSWTVDAMEKYGGSFVQALGVLARRADMTKLPRIKMAFPEIWTEYEGLGIGLEKKSV